MFGDEGEIAVPGSYIEFFVSSIAPPRRGSFAKGRASLHIVEEFKESRLEIAEVYKRDQIFLP